MVLDEKGRITEHGPFQKISESSEYVKNLVAQPAALPTTRAPEVELSDETLEELELPDEDEDKTRQTGDCTVYGYYFRAVGGVLMSLLIFSCAAFVFDITFPEVWLQMWTRFNEDHPNQRVGYWLGVYGALGGMAILITFGASWMFELIIVPKTARKFHTVLLDTTMKATTSFLTSTDTGLTVNRFSQDLELINSDLPDQLQSTLISVFSCIADAVLVFIGSTYISTAVPVVLVIVYFIQIFYLRTSRQLRFLDIDAKAPLFSQFLEALSGLSTIRSYGWGDSYKERNKVAFLASPKPYYLMYCIQRWLNLILDLMVACLAILLVALATTLRGHTYSSFLGVALFSIVSFSGSLNQLIKSWTVLETAIGAISRIREFALSMPAEDLSHETGSVPPEWPKDGAVSLRQISASYESSTEPVLEDITLEIKSGEKVGICGRTGSGKSSLISSILRLLELDQGSIEIDGLDISTIPRHEIRSRLNTLPQEPFFLHGTVRLNVDPLEIQSDDQIIEALETAGLWDYFESKGGLDEELEDDKLSSGQRQLFCLARATCKSGAILIVDEATSSVDSKTDELMQKIFREKFKSQTMIVIAHKLHTILDFDRVAVLDKGRLVEYDAPEQLLARDSSAFKTLYESSLHGDTDALQPPVDS